MRRFAINFGIFMDILDHGFALWHQSEAAKQVPAIEPRRINRNTFSSQCYNKLNLVGGFISFEKI